MIGAHYDHLGFGGEESLAPESGEAHNGADDNASGTAALLEAARLVAARRESLQRDVFFAAFTGEEKGLLGSSELARNPLPGMAPSGLVAMLNMDMVGRLRNNRVSVLGGDSAEEWREIVLPLCAELGLQCQLGGDGYGPSDQTPFYAAGVPVLHFFTGQHEDYHKPGDDSEKLNYDGMNLISDYIFDVISDLDNNGKLAFRKTKNESDETPRFKVGLGVVPDYLFDGEGMRIDGVSEEKPAQRAGLLKGDVVVRLGDSSVVDMMSYMRALSVFEKGNKTKVKVIREGKEVEVDIEF